MGKKISKCLLVAAGVCFAAPAWAQVHITEFMYDGPSREFVEITNRGGSAVDFTGWTLDDGDNNPAATSVAIGAFGIVNPNESVIVAQAADAATFRSAWALPATVKVITYTTGLFQRNDTILVLDAENAPVTQLAYGDQTFAGTPRTNEDTAWPCGEAVGLAAVNTAGITSWRLSTVSDSQGSIVSTNADIGSPGSYTYFACFCGDNAIVGNEECDGTEVSNCASGICNPDCTCQAAPVPTVSEWGLVVLTLVGLTAGTIMFNRVKTVRA